MNRKEYYYHLKDKFVQKRMRKHICDVLNLKRDIPDEVLDLTIEDIQNGEAGLTPRFGIFLLRKLAGGLFFIKWHGKQNLNEED